MSSSSFWTTSLEPHGGAFCGQNSSCHLPQNLQQWHWWFWWPARLFHFLLRFWSSLVPRVPFFLILHGGCSSLSRTSLWGNVLCQSTFSYQLLYCILKVVALRHPMPETVTILTKEELVGASPCLKRFWLGESFYLSNFLVHIGKGHVEGSILMVSSDAGRLCLFPRALLLMGVHLLLNFGSSLSWQ